MKIFITRLIPEPGIDLLKKNGFDVSVYRKDHSLPKSQLKKAAKDCDGLISMLSDKIDKEIINTMGKCKIIANYAVGFNNIDINYAKQKGIVVSNTPDVLTDSTADLTMALVLSCTRRLSEAEDLVRNKNFLGWKPKLLLGTELKNKYFGILGAGRIGSEVAKRAYAFGCRILYYSNSKNTILEKNLNARRLSLDSILKRSDIISIHLPLNAETKNILTPAKLNLLKASSYLINTARGEVLDEAYLIKLLKEKKICAAGFDVYQNEPDLNKEFYKLKNVVLLPHIGSATIEARNQMSLLAAKNIIAVLTGKKALSPV